MNPILSPHLQTLFPSDRLTAIEDVLREVFPETPITGIEKMNGGLSAASVYKLTAGGQAYVLKLDKPMGLENPDAGVYAVVADTEAADSFGCMEIAANAGIAPPAYRVDRKRSISITGFVENRPLRSPFAAQGQLMTELAKTIRSVHALPPFPKDGSLLETIETLIGETKTSPLFTDRVFGNFFGYWEDIRKYYPWNDSDRVSSHNDLNPSNLLYDGKKIWIVDWDAAFCNDRYVDLAVAANFFLTDASLENLYLGAYFGESPAPYHKARFFVMRQVCRLIYALLLFKLAYTSYPSCMNETDEEDLRTANLRSVGGKLGSGLLSLSHWKGQLLFGKAMINEALASMEQPRFADSIEQITRGAHP